LLPWGYARIRTIEGVDGQSVRLRPRRVRCPGCAKTHVLLPAASLPRCSASSGLVGQVLLAAALGGGHRSIAATLGRSEATVRRWLRRARANAGWPSRVGMAI
jgi:transposase-like protein